jgi:hypothetical protein
MRGAGRLAYTVHLPGVISLSAYWRASRPPQLFARPKDN